MKRPLTFSENLDRLANAFSRGVKSDSTEFVKAISNHKESLIIVGSGASYSTAMMLSRILEYYFKIPVRCKTPFEYSESFIQEGTILISASGRNHDILNALNHALTVQPKLLVIVTSNKKNLLLERANGYPNLVSLIVDFENKNEREGFLGSQSLIAFAGAFINLIPELRTQIKNPLTWCKSRCNFARESLVKSSKLISSAAKSEHLVAVHTFWGTASVVDFESKFVEGGLGYIEKSEAKNYTHGRFVNSIRRKKKSMILFFATPNDQKMLDLFRKNIGTLIPVFPIISPYSYALGSIDLMITMFFIFNKIAALKKINISRPKVPDEAREMFDANNIYPFLNLEPALERASQSITVLKRQILFAKGITKEEAELQVPYPVVRASLVNLYSQSFKALMCDYDGTLVPIEMKDQNPPVDIISVLIRLLKANIPVSVVTGRGKSVIKNLKSVVPKSLCGNMYCYLYNGAVLWRLNDATPKFVKKIDNIDEVFSLVKSISQIEKKYINVEKASLECQITIHPKSPRLTDQIFPIVKRHILRKFPNLTVASSGRSIDIFPSGVSKVTACDHFSKNVIKNREAPILRIGDRGDEDGNDFGFLQLSNSFSVDRFYWLPFCGFPIITNSGDRPVGIRGTACIFNSIVLTGNQFTLLPL